jgi:hypothetical protein
MEIKMNHDVRTMHLSLGISDDRADTITGEIMYELVNQQYLVTTLYDNPEQAPRNMVTKTGVLEKVLESTKNDSEIILATWELSRMDAINDASEKMGDKFFSMVSMMFMMADRNKEKFIKLFKEKKRSALENMNDEDDDN